MWLRASCQLEVGLLHLEGQKGPKLVSRELKIKTRDTEEAQWTSSYKNQSLNLRVAAIAIAILAIALYSAGPSDATIAAQQPFFMVQTALSAPAPAERESFARRLLANTIGFDEFRVVQSGPIHFGPQQGHEMMAEGKDPKNGVELSFVQWLRFAGSGYMRMLGIARRDVWAEAFPRMRALRDGIEPK